jgi:hypothetical protein
MKNPIWLPLSIVFWVGATVPLTVWYMGESNIPNVIGSAASTVIIPTLIFSWALSNRLGFKMPSIPASALFGALYGAGHAIVIPASLHFLTQQLLTGHIQLPHIINGLYMFVTPWLIAKYSSRCTCSIPGDNQ